MKKHKRFIVFAIFLFMFFVILELICNHVYLIQNYYMLPPDIMRKSHFFLPYKSVYKFNPNFEFFYDDSRTYPDINHKNGAVSVVGCSCTEGIGLNNNETFSAVLNKLTGRKVYSRAKAGRGLPYVYYQIDNKLLPKDTEYIVYFYLPFHLLTLYNYQEPLADETSIVLKYVQKDGKIVLKRPLNFLSYYSLYSVKLFQEFLTYRNFCRELFDYSLYSEMIIDMIDKLKINYPKTKFVLVKFQVEEERPAVLPEKLEETLQDKGVIILDAEKLTGEKYYLLENKLEDEKVHPNARVWKKLTPKIVEAVGL